MKQALGFALFLLLPAAATASGFLLFQHGGRTTSQAGAFAARASDPIQLPRAPSNHSTIPPRSTRVVAGACSTSPG